MNRLYESPGPKTSRRTNTQAQQDEYDAALKAAAKANAKKAE